MESHAHREAQAPHAPRAKWRIGMERFHIKKNDLYLIGLLLAAALCCLLLVWLMKKEGGQVVVYVGGEQTASFSLGQDRTYTIHAGNGVNELVIKDGTAYLTDADCPDKLCVGMGRIRYDGQTIVCLPHRVVIAIEGGEAETVSGSDDEVIDIVAK